MKKATVFPLRAFFISWYLFPLYTILACAAVVTATVAFLARSFPLS